MESHRGADAFAAQDVAKLIQRLAEYTLGLQWEKTKGLGRTKSRCLWPSDAHPSHSVRCEARDCGVGLLPEWKQSGSVYPMLDREGQAVTAGQR